MNNTNLEKKSTTSEHPKITIDRINECILEVVYFTAQEGVKGSLGENCSLYTSNSLAVLTFCVIVLRNGFTVSGESACVSPENFDAEIGRKLAFEKAKEKIWLLEAYNLKTELYNKK